MKYISVGLQVFPEWAESPPIQTCRFSSFLEQYFMMELKRWAYGHKQFVLEDQEKDSSENCVLLLFENANRFAAYSTGS